MQPCVFVSSGPGVDALRAFGRRARMCERVLVPALVFAHIYFLVCAAGYGDDSARRAYEVATGALPCLILLIELVILSKAHSAIADLVPGFNSCLGARLDAERHRALEWTDAAERFAVRALAPVLFEWWRKADDGPVVLSGWDTELRHCMLFIVSALSLLSEIDVWYSGYKPGRWAFYARPVAVDAVQYELRKPRPDSVPLEGRYNPSFSAGRIALALWAAAVFGWSVFSLGTLVDSGDLVVGIPSWFGILLAAKGLVQKDGFNAMYIVCGIVLMGIEFLFLDAGIRQHGILNEARLGDAGIGTILFSCSLVLLPWIVAAEARVCVRGVFQSRVKFVSSVPARRHSR